MDERIGEVIAKLKADSNGLAFTGFITNAYVTHPSALRGRSGAILVPKRPEGSLMATEFKRLG